MEATVRRGLKYCNKVYQPGEMIEGPVEALWPLALQAYIDLPEDFKGKLSDESKKELDRVQKGEASPTPMSGTPRLPGNAVIPTPPPKLAQQPQPQQQRPPAPPPPPPHGRRRQ